MYGLNKTHKENNPVRIFTIGCGRVFINFFEKYLYKKVNKIDSTIKNTPDMLNTIDMINNSNIFTKNSVLASFDIVNMFPSIDVSGVEAASEILENGETDFPPAECILEVLKLCLECSTTVINDKFYILENCIKA